MSENGQNALILWWGDEKSSNLEKDCYKLGRMRILRSCKVERSNKECTNAKRVMVELRYDTIFV